MAGDWIKLEHATPNKPEVYRFADLLGVEPDHGLGILVRFWIWLDRNSRDGSVTHVFAKPLEKLMHCPGFVAAMIDIGWLEMDEKTGRITVPNHDRHNGNPAKSRALARDRMQRLRYDSVTQDASPEKRREELNTTTNTGSQPAAALPPVDKSEAPPKLKGQKRLQGSALPTGFAISDRVRQWAAAKGYVSLETYLELFVGRNAASGKRYVDWDAAFMNAIREDWYGVRNGGQHKRSVNAWWSTEQATLEMGRTVGINPRGNETWSELRARIADRLSQRKSA